MRISYLLVLIVIIVSGNPAVFVINKNLVYILTFIVLAIYAVKHPKPIIKYDFLFVMFFVFLFVIQNIFYGQIVLMASLGFLIKIGIAALAVRIIPGFFHKFVLIMVFLAGLSLIFYIPTLLGIDLRGILSVMKIPLSSDIVHIGLHNFHVANDTRNSGIFWEPGAFAGYLVLALFLASILERGVQKSWHAKLLIAALISTQSTTGFIAGFIVLVLYFYEKTKYSFKLPTPILFSFILLFSVTLGWFLSNNISFIGTKIDVHLSKTIAQEGNYKINRFGNINYDLGFIAERPIIGWGANPATRFTMDPELAELMSGQGVGLTGSIIKFGIPGFLLYIFYFYRGCISITGSKSYAIGGGCMLCILLIGEQFLNYPLFFTLVFLNFYPRSFFTAAPR